jgi:hypothetical protein
MPSTKLRRCGYGRRRTRLSFAGFETRFCSPKLECDICFALTNDLVNDARDRCGGVDHDTVFRNVLLRLMQSHNEFPFRLFSAPLIFRSLVKPPVQCVKVDLKYENAVKQIYEF